MLNSLKQAGKDIGREINRAWENLSEGWRELLSRGSESLTHFVRRKDASEEDSEALATLPRWSLLAGEVEETPADIVVRVEVPGMNKEDCSITIEGNVLHLSGEKHFERETHESTYHVMERAYGAFQRAIPLPRNVNIDKAEAHYKNGVLTVRLPKEGSGKAKAKAIQVS
ncbi:MAG: Hsp20/alpha crystallin family protein [Polaromonas sp.]|jgi:HSP20 family protein|uniref:Hsp20/alpha crystallin family protein n=1 Tax=Polaromonas sp. TaxID=1869339 RepID=UPI002730B59B|nr:Hsp20/alpha crystallin family protein [Polaromonas sp.]MDP2256162.1 Hsp20/alpha crystallin family protein [Polaromonas sp.]MDP3709318.1 Hsp20/alpha crystallin family protein [Polaromonas sp.]